MHLYTDFGKHGRKIHQGNAGDAGRSGGMDDCGNLAICEMRPKRNNFCSLLDKIPVNYLSLDVEFNKGFSVVVSPPMSIEIKR